MDSREQGLSFKEQMGLTYPILFDEGGSVLEMYNVQRNIRSSVYPQDWIIGVDGKVAYANGGYEPDEMKAVLDRELSR